MIMDKDDWNEFFPGVVHFYRWEVPNANNQVIIFLLSTSIEG